MNLGISVCLLAKNCAVSLKDCLESLKEFLRPDLGDEVIVVDTGSTDEGATQRACEPFMPTLVFHSHPELNVPGMLDLVKQYLPEHYEQCAKDPQFSDGFLADFSAARNLSFSYAKNDLVFWIDSDDVLLGGRLLRDVCLEFFKNPANTALFLPYDYSRDPDGSINTLLWRERIVRKSCFTWRGTCHETLCPLPGVTISIQKCDPSCRIDHRHEKHHVFSDIRNYAIMRKEYESADWKDPRLEIYLGNAARGLAGSTVGHPLYAEALNWYERGWIRSGSRDDRVNVGLNIAYIHLLHQRPWEALEWCHAVQKIHPADPRVWYCQAQAYFDLGQYQNCLLFVGLGRTLPVPEYHVSVDPLQLDYFPTLFQCRALHKLGQYQEALRLAHQLMQMRPAHQPIAVYFNEILTDTQIDQTKRALGTVCTELAFSPAAAHEIIERVKPEVRHRIRELQRERFCTKPQKSVTVLCGGTVEPWDPTCLEQPGVGGSEKMVILLARELAKRGWFVDVYGSPKDESAYRSFDGVTYRPFQSFNPTLPRDVLISWRSPSLCEAKIQCRKLYVDMHDVTTPGDWTPARVQPLTRALFKSRFHRAGAASALPDEKALVLRNAVDVAALEKLQSIDAGVFVPRNRNHIVWCSSADRGLKRALTAFGALKRKHPTAQFHVYYGFTPLYFKKAADQEYQYFGDEHCERHMYDYHLECLHLMDQTGAHFHGRVGHTELMQALLTANIWLYPTRFPEISCMSAMEAQCCGAIPVCSRTGALAETVDWGVPLDTMDPVEIVGALDHVLTQGEKLDEHRAQMQIWAREKFALPTLVDQLEEEFLS